MDWMIGAAIEHHQVQAAVAVEIHKFQEPGIARGMGYSLRFGRPRMQSGKRKSIRSGPTVRCRRGRPDRGHRRSTRRAFPPPRPC